MLERWETRLAAHIEALSAAPAPGRYDTDAGDALVVEYSLSYADGGDAIRPGRLVNVEYALLVMASSGRDAAKTLATALYNRLTDNRWVVRWGEEGPVDGANLYSFALLASGNQGSR